MRKKYDPANRVETIHNLYHELDTIGSGYVTLYDLRYTQGKQQAEAITRVADILIPLSSIIEVCARDGVIYPDYAIEKLNLMKTKIEREIQIWETKGCEMLNHDLHQKD